MTNIMIDKDEWMEVWNSNTELQDKVKSLESKLFNLEERISELEHPFPEPKTVSIYGKEVKVRE